MRKPLWHKQRVPQLPTETAEAAEVVWAESVGVNRGGGRQGVAGWTAWEEMEGNQEVISLPLALVCQKTAY